MRPLRALAAFVATALVLAPGPARAEVRELADRLEGAWHSAGARVARLPPRFVFESETAVLPIPALDGHCLTVAVIGPRGLSFRARTGGDAEDDPLDDAIERAASVAGAAEITRCASGDFSRLRVTSDAGRGAIEILVAASPQPLPGLKTVLPERGGALAPSALEPGGSPPLAPAPKRADAAELRARNERAQEVARDGWIAGDDGAGTQRVTLRAGCHRFELFGSEARAPRRRIDIDAELRDDASDTTLARDRSEAADARLEACVGEPTQAHLTFNGAGAGAAVLAVHASWPVPERLPWAWGAQGRARMAEALIARHVLPPTTPAALLAQGVRAEGSLLAPVVAELDPAGCYVAIAAVASGISRGIGLRASLGARDFIDDRGPAEASALVAFCARGAARARLEVDARGAPGTVWALALFRVAGTFWEPP